LGVMSLMMCVQKWYFYAQELGPKIMPVKPDPANFTTTVDNNAEL
jgi:hypothetical protein